MPRNTVAAKSGDRLKALEELRDTLADQLDNTTSQVHAQLAAQYRATLADIAEVKGEAKPKGGVDELKRRRQSKDRLPAAHASGNP